jgi:hypothetical protein
MATFYSGDVSLPASSATKLIDADEVDRMVYLGASPSTLGFSSAEVTGRTNGFNPGSPFVLPAGKELWVFNSGGAATAGVFVTAIAR